MKTLPFPRIHLTSRHSTDRRDRRRKVGNFAEILAEPCARVLSRLLTGFPRAHLRILQERVFRERACEIKRERLRQTPEPKFAERAAQNTCRQSRRLIRGIRARGERRRIEICSAAGFGAAYRKFLVPVACDSWCYQRENNGGFTARLPFACAGNRRDCRRASPAVPHRDATRTPTRKRQFFHAKRDKRKR